MEKLLEKLRESGSSCIVQSAGGETRYFRQRGVADLYSLVCSDPAFLKGATVADKVVGKAAAALMIKGGVASVYTNMISEPAAGLLAGSAIKVSYGQIVHHMENRSRTDWCPLEKLLYRESSIEKIFTVISDFVANL